LWKYALKNDKKRAEELENISFTVIRFSDDEALKNMDEVIFEIERIFEDLLHPL
jgi:very-short-patch-repair endonuclease